MTTATSPYIITMPISSGGLLTTVEQLPSKYKIRYLARTTMIERPLDLTVKLQNQEETASNNSTSTITTLISTNNNNHNGPITPPPSPPKKNYRNDEHFMNISTNNDDFDNKFNNKIRKLSNDIDETSLKISKELITPSKQSIGINSIAPKTSKTHPITTTTAKEKKSKAIRKLKFDEETSSPVSGTIIRPIEEILDNIDEHQSGDIDPQYNIVEITEEAKSELAAIKNVIGAYVCKLCRLEFDDAFGLAQHRCSCIVLLEYRCPECGKRFNCPANLASHRRWHKPKDEILKKQQQHQQQKENQENELQLFQCQECGKQFKRQAYLRKHLLTHKQRCDENGDNKKPLKKMKNNKKIKLDNIRSDYRSGTNSINSISEDYNSSSQSSLSAAASIYHEPIDSIINATNHNHVTVNYDNRQFYKYDSDSRSSDCSSPGRLQIIENNLTEEENIAAAALAHLRNGQSVIQHTHATMAF